MPLWTILTKWPAPFGPAVQVAVLGGAAGVLAGPGVRGRRVDAGASVAKIGSRCCTDVVLAADHLAVAALQAPDAAAGADVDVVDALGLQLRGAADVVEVVGVAAVDDDVAGLQGGTRSASVVSTTAAGTISQTARGWSASCTKSSSDDAPSPPEQIVAVHRCSS